MHKALPVLGARRVDVPCLLPFSSLTISAPLPFSSKLQPLLRLVASERAQPRRRFRQDVSQNLYRGGREEVRRRSGGGGVGEEEPRVRGWDGRVGDVAEARAVFEKGEPRHISLQTNNFWIFISCFSLPACVPISKANATLTTFSSSTIFFPILLRKQSISVTYVRCWSYMETLRNYLLCKLLTFERSKLIVDQAAHVCCSIIIFLVSFWRWDDWMTLVGEWYTWIDKLEKLKNLGRISCEASLRNT